MTATRGRVDPRREKLQRRHGVARKNKILDAAESMFVRHGYYGTTVRQIAAAAQAPLALLSYHFGSKEALFRAVIERRAQINATSMHDALRGALANDGRNNGKLEAILRAFIEPVVDHSMRGGRGWKNYIRLMAQIANLPQHESFVRAVPENYEPTVRAFIDAIRALYPKMSETDLHWSFYFYQAAITHILVESGVVDRQSAGACRSADLDQIVPKLVRYCAAGFGALAASSDGKTVKGTVKSRSLRT